jgi:hypothetical protein
MLLSLLRSRTSGRTTADPTTTTAKNRWVRCRRRTVWRCVRRTAVIQSSFRKILSQTSRGGLGRTPSRESDEVQRVPPPPNGGPRRTTTLACAPKPSSTLEGPTPRASASAPAIKSIHTRRQCLSRSTFVNPRRTPEKGPRGDITHPLQHFPACLLQHEQKQGAMRHSTSDSALVSGARGFDGGC